MKKVYCDRCHRVITERKSFIWQYIRFFMDEDYEKVYDLCPKCYKEIEAFIHNYKATNTTED